MVIALLLLGIANTGTCIADNIVPNNELTSVATGGDDSDSASAIITITWRTAPLPDK